jgi:choline kinase
MHNSMTAFIYAAGRGIRLGKEFADRQKILLEFDGKSLLEWHVQRLIEVGVKRLAVVTGYKRETIRSRFAALKRGYGITLTEIVNADFTEGSVLSMNASIPAIARAEGPVLIMDGDVLYPAEMLRRLIQSPHPSALLIDREYSTQDDDPVLVPIRNDRPVEFLKRWQGEADQVGESIGFFKIDPADIPLLIEETRQRSVGERRNESYDEVLRALVLTGRFGYEDVTGIPWTEIDFPNDVVRAETKVLPAILRYDGFVQKACLIAGGLMSALLVGSFAEFTKAFGCGALPW